MRSRCGPLPGRPASRCLVVVFAVACCQLPCPPASHAPPAGCAQRACLQAMLLLPKRGRLDRCPTCLPARPLRLPGDWRGAEGDPRRGAARQAGVPAQPRQGWAGHAGRRVVELCWQMPGCCCMLFSRSWRCPASCCCSATQIAAVRWMVCRGSEEGAEESQPNALLSARWWPPTQCKLLPTSAPLQRR